MEIRYCTEKDIDEIKQLWKYCFQDSEGFFQYYFEHKFSKDNTIVVVEENQVVSSVQLNPYKILIRNQSFDTSYIVGVSTYPEARGNGYIKKLMSCVLNILYEKEHSVAILMPIDYRLYRSYGFEHCYDLYEYHLDVSSLHGYKKKGIFRRVTDQDTQKLVEIYRQFLVCKHGYILRDQKYFNLFLEEISSEDGQVYIYSDENNKPQGYIVYYFQEQNLFVREMFYLNQEALEAMLHFIYQHNTQVKRVVLHTPIQDLVHFVLPNLRDTEVKIKPFIMGRVIHLKNFLQTIDVTEKWEGSVIFQIKDSWIAENNKIYEWFFDDCNSKITVTEKKPQVIIGIDTFSQIVFGRLTIEEACLLNRVEGDKIAAVEWLSKLFARTVNYIDEYV